MEGLGRAMGLTPGLTPSCVPIFSDLMETERRQNGVFLCSDVQQRRWAPLLDLPLLLSLSSNTLYSFYSAHWELGSLSTLSCYVV